MFIGIRVRKSVATKVISAGIEGAVIGSICNYFDPPEGSLLVAPLAGSIACISVVLVFQWFDDRQRRKALEE
ncbi:MAG: hypothetical protein V4558_08825 [Gemmatimonadota bacterium]